MSSLSNSWIKEAWIAAPFAVRSEGFMAMAEVEGERMAVHSGKRDCSFWATLGVWDVPPDNITCGESA